MCNYSSVFAKIFKKNLFAFPHTSNADFLPDFKNIPPNTKFKDYEKLISIEKNSFSYNYYILGFKNQILVGNPRKNKIFKNFISNFEFLENQFILISSYRSVKQFFDQSVKEQHFINIYKLIRRHFGNIKVLIKCHPRENTNETLEIINKNNFINIEITKSNSLILSNHALCTIGFTTSGTYNSFYCGKPAINYFEYRRKFEEYTKNSLQYEFLKIKVAEDKCSLEDFLINLKENKYIIPNFFEGYDNEIIFFDKKYS